MSRHTIHEHVTIADNTEVLEVIREECSPALSSVHMDSKPNAEEQIRQPCSECSCVEKLIKNEDDEKKKHQREIDKLLKQKEEVMKAEYEKQLDKEIANLKERFDFILQNEQIRTSHMLREAHRERQEKVTALQTQLECKNLAGLMFVLCSERRKSKLEKLRLIEEYTGYIHALQDILSEGQEIILNLSRGYKTAARVDQEWREKMTKVMKEFQYFVHNYAGGTSESNQYFFDLPALMKTEAPIVDDPEEDPCEVDEPVEYGEEEIEPEEVEDADKWWNRLEGDCRPFMVFGDMAEFKPNQRREVLRKFKTIKTAPRKWKEYVFNDMYVKKTCSNVDVIKDEYPKHLPVDSRWECHVVQQGPQDRQASKLSISSRRPTAPSVDIRGDMGSILKIITSTVRSATKAVLLGARDSMEIASTTKLRDKMRQSEHSRVVINVDGKKLSKFDQFDDEDFSEKIDDECDFPDYRKNEKDDDEDDYDESESAIGSVHNDSLHVIPTHVPDKDHKINYEKVCPIDKCQRMQGDSFMHSLPAYMRASPFMHFEQTYEDYETCSPEQLAFLRKRLEEKKNKERRDLDRETGMATPTAEWRPSVSGVAAQTSELSMSLPPCTCRAPSPSPASSVGFIYNLKDLIPVKEALNEINKQCFYDSRIQFDRIKVIGQGSHESMTTQNQESFKNTRQQEIRKILKQHPSLLEIFQANTQC